MKKIVFLTVLLFVVSVHATDYPPVSVDVALERVSKHVYYARGDAGVATENEGFISNAGVVITADGVIVFDALGTPSLAAALLAEIRKLTDKPVRKVIVSHYHADHIYGLQVFREAGAKIIAPAGVYEYIDSPAAAELLEDRRFSLEPWVNDETHIVEPDQLVSGEQKFSLGGVDFTVLVTGAAHSVADLTLFVEPDRVLFSGDIIFEGRIPFVGDADTRYWLQVLDSMRKQRLTALIPGHGAAAGDPDQAIAFTYDYLSFLRASFAPAVEEMDAFEDAYEAVDWSRWEGWPAFDLANRRNAWQVYLSLERESFGD